MWRAGVAGKDWDAVVIGAGVAGCVVAHALAGRGFAVLLAEREHVPRFKVCGGCLSEAALSSLRAAGLGQLACLAAAPRLERLELAVGGRLWDLPLPGGVAVRRSHLDGELAAAAVAEGVHLVEGVRAELGPVIGNRREVRLSGGGGRRSVMASLVIAASGLGGGSLGSEAALRPRVARGSRLGAGAVLEDQDATPGTGIIRMTCGRGGYVGQVAVEGGGLVVAAALDPYLVRTGGGVGGAVTRILAASGRPVPRGLANTTWKATPRLTRAVGRAAAERVMLVGDAAGYAEPFTGEGMTWAIESALIAAPRAAEAMTRWGPAIAAGWTAEHRRRFAARHRRCRRVARIVRHPWAATAVLSVTDLIPQVTEALVRRLARAEIGS
jgi:menaquinone-9 beta-reductase